MDKIDINFDYRNDSYSGDPDKDSLKLAQAQKFLWSKTLPCGKAFDLEVVWRDGRYLLESDLGNLSSDRMCPHFDRKYNGEFDGWLAESKVELLKYKVRTIGGHIVFPAHQINRKFTINQARGINKRIADRFDLTLECIRRFYRGEESPLYDTFERYKDFFDLFVDFNGYTEFFLLQDFVDEEQQINFSLPFTNFEKQGKPLSKSQYEQYQVHTIELIDKRNKKIFDFSKILVCNADK